MGRSLCQWPSNWRLAGEQGGRGYGTPRGLSLWGREAKAPAAALQHAPLGLYTLRTRSTRQRLGLLVAAAAVVQQRPWGGGGGAAAAAAAVGGYGEGVPRGSGGCQSCPQAVNGRGVGFLALVATCLGWGPGWATCSGVGGMWVVGWSAGGSGSPSGLGALLSAAPGTLRVHSPSTRCGNEGFCWRALAGGERMVGPQPPPPKGCC